MKLSRTRTFLFIGLLSTLALFSISSSASAINLFPQQSAGCTPGTLDCYGEGGGGYGTHLTGGGGSGNLAGYSLVRFDGYRPEPSLEICTRVNDADVRALTSLGLRNSNAPRYWHRRVATLRSDGVTATHGVPQAQYWDSGLEVNLNGSPPNNTRPADPTNLDRAPTQSSPWIGPQWLGNRVCLPLSGGAQIMNELQNKEPEIRVLHNDTEIPFVKSDLPDLTSNDGRVLLRSKNLYLEIRIEESARSSGGIDIEFEALEDQIKINVGSLKKFFEWVDAGKDPETGGEIWSDGKSKKSPIYVDFSKAGEPTKANVGPNTTVSIYKVPIIVKRKGIFAISVDANYNAYVGGQASGVTPFTGLSGSSESLWIKAVSVKSVNRR